LAHLAVEGRVAKLTLNRPQSRNALSLPLLEALHAIVDELAAKRDELSVVEVTGAGKSFCAGMDLKAVLSDPAAASKLLHSLADLTFKLRTLPQVTVAKVNGAAIGGGCGLACVCDITLTHADSKMGFPEVDLGVCPAVVAPWLMRKIGPGRARRVLLAGGLLSGQQAFELGMADAICTESAGLDQLAQEYIERLSRGGPMALAATKGMLNQLDGSMDADVLRRGADLSAKIIMSDATLATLREKLR